MKRKTTLALSPQADANLRILRTLTGLKMNAIMEMALAALLAQLQPKDDVRPVHQ